MIVLFATLSNADGWEDWDDLTGYITAIIPEMAGAAEWCLSILKVLELFRPNLSMKKKRFIISMNPPEFLEQVLAF